MLFNVHAKPLLWDEKYISFVPPSHAMKAWASIWKLIRILKLSSRKTNLKHLFIILKI